MKELRRLRAGDTFKLHPDCIPRGKSSPVYQVMRVSDCSATVRSLSSTHVVITGPGGEPTADFWKAGRPFNISPNSSVILTDAPDSTEGDH